MKPSIDKDLCARCGQCVEICPYEVFSWSDDYVIVANPEDCIECTACVEQCPWDALSMSD